MLTSQRCSVFFLALVVLRTQSTLDDPLLPHSIASDVIPLDVCAQIIAASEKWGFSTDTDSIDNHDDIKPPVWDVQLFRNGMVEARPVLDLVKPYLPEIEKQIREMKMTKNSTKETSFDWIFVRKYSSTGLRDRLRAHTDSNDYSANVFLNSRVTKKDKNNFVGGGIFLTKDVGPVMETLDFLADLSVYDPYFPKQEAGSVMVHDHEIWHGIAPIEEGTKYSLLLFADMTPDQIGGIMVSCTFLHNANTDDSLSLVWCEVTENEFAENKDCTFEDDLAPGDAVTRLTHDGHYFRMINAFGDVFADWVVDYKRGGGGIEFENKDFFWADFINDSEEDLQLSWTVDEERGVLKAKSWAPNEHLGVSVAVGRTYEASNAQGETVMRWHVESPGTKEYTVKNNVQRDHKEEKVEL